VIHIAAVGDVHFDRSSGGRLASHFDKLVGRADMLLIAGDLTQTGHWEEGKTLADDLAQCPIPVVAVLGNHDYNLDHDEEIMTLLRDAGVIALERDTAVFKIRDESVGIVGLKGFGGGFIGACATDFGEHQMKTFVRHTKEQADFLRTSLEELNTDYKIALLHYSPIAGTLHGEKKEIYPFLGSYLLGEAIDEVGADIIFHGHAHRGVEHGQTAGGIPVRNVAQHVIRHVFNIYSISPARRVEALRNLSEIAWPNPT
jgi:Icc-related predicted phosphoesterase